MIEYNISGSLIKIPSQVANERYVRLSTKKLISNIGEIFDTWYSAQRNCEAVYDNSGTLLVKTVVPLISKSVKILNAQGVYSLDEKLFMTKYLNGYDNIFYDVLEKMMDRISEIDEQLEAEQQYRKARKASRGKVVGGGFGLGGALKGMATAGIMNAATGMAHSIGNSVGNLGSGISASSSKSAVYKNTKEPLREAIIRCGYNIREALRTALEVEANIKCKSVTVTENAQAKAILQNYSQKRIPEAQCKEQIIQALILDPYNLETYELIWNDFGDKNGDLRKMSTYFGCGLEQKIQEMASKYGEDIFKTDCEEYLNAFNKTKAIIQTETNIKAALTKMEEYCQKHDIEEKLIPKIPFCRELLETADKESRTVEGVLYTTRETAEKVKADYLRFYKNLQGRDLTNDEQFKEILGQTYSSIEFNDMLPSLCENEKLLRTPEKIRDSLWNVFSSRLDESVLTAIGLEIAERFGEFNKNETTVRTITGMPENEIPLFVIERSNNGKSGIMITDKNLRIYSKGFLSSENYVYDIGKIKGIECVGNNKFVIKADEYGPINVTLKTKNVSDEDQIIFASTFEKAVQTINNLYPAHLQNLYRILYGVRTCECGTKLLENEKVCPSCRKMLNQNGEYIEAEYCPSCNAPIPKGKKFCANCGLHIKADSKNNLNIAAPSTSNNISSEIQKEFPQNKTGENLSEDLFTQCHNCGNNIKIGYKFCPKCGSPLKKHCPKCNSAVSATQKFCHICGEKL